MQTGDFRTRKERRNLMNKIMNTTPDEIREDIKKISQNGYGIKIRNIQWSHAIEYVRGGEE